MPGQMRTQVQCWFATATSTLKIHSSEKHCTSVNYCWKLFWSQLESYILAWLHGLAFHTFDHLFSFLFCCFHLFRCSRLKDAILCGEHQPMIMWVYICVGVCWYFFLFLLPKIKKNGWSKYFLINQVSQYALFCWCAVFVASHEQNPTNECFWTLRLYTLTKPCTRSQPKWNYTDFYED